MGNDEESCVLRVSDLLEELKTSGQKIIGSRGELWRWGFSNKRNKNRFRDTMARKFGKCVNEKRRMDMNEILCFQDDKGPRQRTSPSRTKKLLDPQSGSHLASWKATGRLRVWGLLSQRSWEK